MFMWDLATLGIYKFVWTYQTFSGFNKNKIQTDKSICEIPSAKMVIVLLLIPIVNIIWLYILNLKCFPQIINEYEKKVGITETDYSLFAMLGILPVINIFLDYLFIQQRINRIVKKQIAANTYGETII